METYLLSMLRAKSEQDFVPVLFQTPVTFTRAYLKWYIGLNKNISIRSMRHYQKKKKTQKVDQFIQTRIRTNNEPPV